MLLVVFSRQSRLRKPWGLHGVRDFFTGYRSYEKRIYQHLVALCIYHLYRLIIIKSRQSICMGNLYNCGDFQPGVPFVFLKASNELFNKVVEARIYLNFL